MLSTDQAIHGLQPAVLWQRFFELSQIPRASKKEEKVTAHLEALFQSLNLKYSRDKVGNLVAKVPASRGYSKAPIVVLQGHSDMVCEKNRDTVHDFDKDPIQLIRDGEWIAANGTTLGADNGIGVAAALAILSDPTAVHGPLEILVTVDEETGLTGANQLSDKRLRGKYLLNLDTEEDNVFCIGCAGGIDTVGTFAVEETDLPAGEWHAFTLRVGGLKGGHSGVDIHLGRANAIKLMARVLHALQSLKPMITDISGGSKRNAIPREAEVTVVLPAAAVIKAREVVAHCQQQFLNEFSITEEDIQLEWADAKLPASVFSTRLMRKLIHTLLAMPCGMLQMSAAIPDLVESSTNLAMIVVENGVVRIGTSQRSSIESAKKYFATSVAATFQLAGAKVIQTDGYPGWQPNIQSDLLRICKTVAVAQTGVAPEIKAIHAGLECGILGNKYPNMEMISFGPTITGAHSPDERVHIPAVRKFYDLLKAVLKAIAEEGK
jgi:dipeptidase D